MPDCEGHLNTLKDWAFGDRFDPETGQPEVGYLGQYAAALRSNREMPTLPGAHRRHSRVLQECASTILAGECVLFSEPLFTANPSTRRLYALIRERPDSSTLDS